MKHGMVDAVDILESVFPNRVREPRAEITWSSNDDRYVIIKIPGRTWYGGMALPSNQRYAPTAWVLIDMNTLTQLDKDEGRFTRAKRERFMDKI